MLMARTTVLSIIAYSCRVCGKMLKHSSQTPFCHG